MALERRPFNRPFFRRPLKPQHNINEFVKAREVRIVGAPEGVPTGVYSREDALAMARDSGVDLVEVNGAVDPAICRLIEYSKFRYELKKKEKVLKKKQHVMQVKELRYGPNTDTHDFEFKLRHAENFLKEGNKVKATVQFMGRTIVYKERGEYLLLQLAERLSQIAKVEQLPRMDGNRMNIILTPKNLSK